MSDGYNIPVGIDFGDSLDKLEQIVASLEKAKVTAAETTTTIANQNKEIVDSGNKANEVIKETAKASLDAKKASEEKARIDERVNQILAEREKLDQKNAKGTRENISGINTETQAIEKKLKLMEDELARLNAKLKLEKTHGEVLKEKVKGLELDIEKTKEQAAAQQGSNVSMKAGTLAANGLRAALMSFVTLGIGAVLAAIAIYWEDIKRGILGVTKEMELQSEIRKKAIDIYADEKAHVENLWRESQRENTSKERKLEIIKELNSISPEYFGGIKTEKDLHEQGVEAIERYIKALQLKARAQVAMDIYVESLKQQMLFEQQTLKQSASAWAQWSGSILELMGAGSKASQLYASSASNNFEEASEATSRAFEAMKVAMDKVSDLGEKGPFAPKKAKVKKDEYMQILESFIRQKRDAEVQAISDETDRAFKAEEVRFEQEKQAIRKRVLEFKGSAKERASLVAQADATIEKLNEAHLAKWGAISLKALEEEVKKEEAANKLIASIRKKDLDQQIKDIEAKYVEINTKVAAGGKLTADIEKELLNAQTEEIDAIKQKHALEALKKDEQIALARIGAMELHGNNEKAVVKLREAMKIQVMIDAAYERLDVLKKAGGVENELIIIQTEALINQLQGKLKGLKPKEGFDLFDLLGINISNEDKRQLEDSFDALLGSLSTIFESNLQRQIDAKDRQIDILSDQVSKIERELDKELDLQEKGYANNVEAKRAEFEAISAERNKAQAEQEELQKRQAQLAAAQIALNGLIQVSELALAAAKIFKAHAGIPFVGVITAIAAVATMVATFASMRAKIAEASSNTPKFRDGGEFILDGPSHERGGLGVYNERTGKRVAEVEGGEGFLAINKKSTQKHRGLLNAINDDDFKDFHEFSASLDEILNHVGISMPEHAEISKVVVIAQQNADKKIEYNNAMLHFAQNSHILDDIAKSNKQMLEIEKGRGQVIDMGDYYLVKTGNVTRRIKKRHAV